jgi:hypothetical protein
MSNQLWEDFRMSKMRSDSKWSELTAGQRETLEGWLFEENIGYQEARERLEKEFGMKASMRALSEFYQMTARQRMEKEFRSVKGIGGEIDKLEVELEDLGGTAMILVAKRMIQLAVDSPDKVLEMASLGRVLVANDAQEIRRRWLEMEEDRRERELRKQNMLEKISLDRKIERWEHAIQMLDAKPKPGATAGGEAAAKPGKEEAVGD